MLNGTSTGMHGSFMDACKPRRPWGFGDPLWFPRSDGPRLAMNTELLEKDAAKAKLSFFL